MRVRFNYNEVERKHELNTNRMNEMGFMGTAVRIPEKSGRDYRRSVFICNEKEQKHK